MNIPIEFNNDSISFSRMPQLNNSTNNSMAFNDMDSRFTGFDLEPMNFNNFEGSLESRLNRELGVCPQGSNNNIMIPTSPIPSSPNAQQVQQDSLFHIEEIPNTMGLASHDDYSFAKEKQIPNKTRRLEPLVLYPFRSVYDVEIAVQQMRAYEACRFAHTDS